MIFYIHSVNHNLFNCEQIHTSEWVMHISVSVQSKDWLKSPKDWLFQHPPGLWSDWNTLMVVSCPTVFMMLQTSLAATVFPPNSSLRSVQYTGHVDKCIWTAGTPCFGWSTAKTHHNFQAVMLNWKQPHDQKPLCGNCFLTDYQWCELHVLFTATDFVFCKFGVLVFLHH